MFVALEEALAPLPVERHDFEHVLAGKKGAPRAERVLPEIVMAVSALAESLAVGTDRLVIGGRSFGGRVCSMAAAEGLRVAGLVLLSYPLHPPGKPDRLRVDHFGRVDVPVLLVSGDRDPFGRPDEFAEHVAGFGGDVESVWVEGGTHDPRYKGREAQVVEAVSDWIRER